MDSLSSPDVASKTSNLASGLLSSLTSLFGANNAGSGVFATFLADDSPVPVAPPAPKIDPPQPAQTSASQGNDSNDGIDIGTNGNSTTGTLQTLVNGLQRIIDRLQHQQAKTTDNNSNTNATANSPSSPSSTTNTSTASATTTSNTAASTSTPGDDGTDSSAGASVIGSNPLSRIISELTDLMKTMEAKLQAAQTASTSASSSTTAATDNSASTGASDPLTQLLTLMQTLQQQLTATATTNGALGAPSSAATGATTLVDVETSPAGAALQDLAQMQKDLKGLMGALKDAGADNALPASALPSGSVSNTTANTPAETLLKDTNAGASGKTSTASQNSLFDLFGNVLGSGFDAPPPLPTYTPVTAPGATGTADSGSSDTSMQDGASFSSGNGSANLNGLSANLTALSGSGDGAKAADPYAFANQLSALRATNGGTVGLPDAVEQVVLQINRGVKDGDDQMTIQLHPADLGKINVKLDISSDGQVRGTVTADNPSTLSMLHKDSRSLERALQEAGLRADPGSLQFNMSGQSGNSSGQTANNSNGSGNSSSGTSDADDGTTGSSLDVPAVADETYYLTPGRVNLKV